MTSTTRKAGSSAGSSPPSGAGSIELVENARAHPFLKWAGGKRMLVAEIAGLFPEAFGSYWEPFLGGGAVFFALESRIRRAYLSDINLDLMLTYRMISTKPEQVIDVLQEHAKKHSKKHYMEIRKKQHEIQDPVLLAAQFIYLNRTCFNGLYRVNKQGRFNVPMGDYENPTICDVSNLLAASEVLTKAVLKAQTFESIEPASGDLVYCDPPYDKAFASYTWEGFDNKDQKSLRDICVEWRDAGVHIVVSNSNTPFIRRIYKGFTLHRVESYRHINCNKDGRGKVTELLITN